MPPQITSPGVYIKELSVPPRSIPAVDTAVAAFLGWAPQGPTDRARHVGSFADYERVFGGLHPESLLGYALLHFFANGGREAHVVRLADDGGHGRTPLAPNDPSFLQRLSAPGQGLQLLDRVDLVNLLCVPGLTAPAALASLLPYGRKRRAFLIADCAESDSTGSLGSGLPPELTGADAMNAAFYFPWVEAPDPLDHMRPRNFPPSGFLAGLYARTDATRGVWKAPAGTGATLAEAKAPAQSLTHAQNRILNPLAINCIRFFPRLGTVSWGARTQHGQDTRGSEWKYVPVRRTALFIAESLERGLRWTAFEPNGEALWSSIHQLVERFLYDLFRRGAFHGASPREAFFVKCGRETTTQHDILQGRVHLLVGFAPLKPAEFVVLKLALKAKTA